ncbi:MAG: hypothetical protein H3C62_02350 [Gemmatimonadaceae bacterium]|nr:hypothetical protein [Gemmatimonadaceae bacterium]
MIFLDYDARRTPRTARYCARCQRDLAPGEVVRVAHLDVASMHLIHPEDVRPEEGILVLLGEDCARRIGWEYTRPEG